MKKILPFVLSAIITTTAGAQCLRSTIIANYNNIYVPTVVTSTELNWTGSTTTCTPGTISDTAVNRTLRRINYLRNLVGVLDNIVFDTSLNRKSQEAALMMSANNTLSHTPPTSWMCYTADGAAAAGSSNLSLGSHSSGSISSFMNDNGSGNFAAGHRRWILYSRAQTFGLGSTNNSTALWVISSPGTTPAISYIAYPSAGFFPAPLVPSSGRWSFGKPNADFSSATVSMTDETGNPVSLTVETVVNGYGDNTIVWVPSGISATGPYDTRYTVEISNVMVGGSPKTFNYDVIIAQPVHPPTCPTGMSWSENDCMCVTGVGISEASQDNSIRSINPFNRELHINASAPLKNIKVFSGNGSLVAEQSVNGSQSDFQFDSEEWSSGLYHISATSADGKVFRLKAIKSE